jgi:hypothetical protein
MPDNCFFFSSKKLRCKNKQINIDYQENPIDILAYFNKFYTKYSFLPLKLRSVLKYWQKNKRFCNFPDYIKQTSCKFVSELQSYKIR